MARTQILVHRLEAQNKDFRAVSRTDLTRVQFRLWRRLSVNWPSLNYRYPNSLFLNEGKFVTKIIFFLNQIKLTMFCHMEGLALYLVLKGFMYLGKELFSIITSNVWKSTFTGSGSFFSAKLTISLVSRLSIICWKKQNERGRKKILASWHFYLNTDLPYNTQFDDNIKPIWVFDIL